MAFNCNCDGRSWLHWSLSPQFRYMIFHMFTCIFTEYGYIVNSQCDQLAVGLMAQLVKHFHRYRKGHGFEWRYKAWIYFFFRFQSHWRSRSVCNCDVKPYVSFDKDAQIVRYHLIDSMIFKSLSFKFELVEMNLKLILLCYSKSELVKFYWDMCQTRYHQAYRHTTKCVFKIQESSKLFWDIFSPVMLHTSAI